MRFLALGVLLGSTIVLIVVCVMLETRKRRQRMNRKRAWEIVEEELKE